MNFNAKDVKIDQQKLANIVKKSSMISGPKEVGDCIAPVTVNEFNYLVTYCAHLESKIKEYKQLIAQMQPIKKRVYQPQQGNANGRKL